jgi:UDP-glucose 4-epimerase
LFVNQIKSNKPLTITDPEMTRFLMSLNDAVDLVLFAFEHGNSGDLFVNKAPASSIGDLAQALQELAGTNLPVNIIGTRHGEKLYETLCTREEMLKAEDMGDFYRVPADHRDLNYALYFSEGASKITEIEDYHSHNTTRLNTEGVKELISNLAYVKKELLGQEIDEFLV